jgi:hypothetical protein
MDIRSKQYREAQPQLGEDLPGEEAEFEAVPSEVQEMLAPPAEAAPSEFHGKPTQKKHEIEQLHGAWDWQQRGNQWYLIPPARFQAEASRPSERKFWITMLNMATKWLPGLEAEVGQRWTDDYQKGRGWVWIPPQSDAWRVALESGMRRESIVRRFETYLREEGLSKAEPTEPEVAEPAPEIAEEIIPEPEVPSDIYSPEYPRD